MLGKCDTRDQKEQPDLNPKRVKVESTTFDESQEWKDNLHRMEVGDEADPGIAIGWNDDAAIHACLGVAGAPVSQGPNAAASSVAMRSWFSCIVTGVNPNSPVNLPGGAPSAEFFHHLTLPQYGQIVMQLISPPVIVWTAALDGAGLSAGRFYMVTASGQGRNDAMVQAYAPFR
jgi:hypothetical protein